MPSFDLATGYVTFKGDFSKFEADITKAKEQAKELDAALNAEIGNQKFLRALHAAKGINAELEKSNRLAKRLQDQVNLGKWGVIRRDMLAGADKFASMAGKFGAGATGIGAGALALGGGSSPLAQSTLEGSFKLLSTTIGGTFIPLVLDVSKGLQDASRTWREMSRGTKDFINSGAKFIGIAGLAALGLSAVAKGFSLIAKHPLITMFSAGIGFAYAWNDRLNSESAERIAGGQTSNMMPLEYVRTDEKTKRLKARGDAGIKEQMKNVQVAWEEYEEKRKTAENYHKGLLGGGGFYEGFLQRTADFTGSRGENNDNRALNAQRRLEEEKTRLDELLPNNKKLKRRAGERASNGDLLWGEAGPISSMGVADLFKSFQAAGLKGGLAGEQAKTDQQQMLELMRKWDEKIGKIKPEANKPVMVQ